MRVRSRTTRVFPQGNRSYSSRVESRNHIHELTSSQRFTPVSDFDLTSGGKDPFDAGTPVVFRRQFKNVPAISKWFIPRGKCHELKVSYLQKHEEVMVPLELSKEKAPSDASGPNGFERFEGPFGLLLRDIGNDKDTAMSAMRLYLAQCPLEDLPSDLRADLPIPHLVSQIGRGDIYGSSLWMGRPPTSTPLHRDPNPNLFVQLAGKKTIRLMKPSAGRKLYERLKTTAGQANMRGEEMMAGEERVKLEESVWNDTVGNEIWRARGWEAELESGDGMYIPLGFWHAVHGVGTDVNASVNWWFR